jgi:hypothetical protein
MAGDVCTYSSFEKQKQKNLPPHISYLLKIFTEHTAQIAR